jgi:hypothetical protein
MWSCVDPVWTDVLKGHIASILRVEKSSSEEPVWSLQPPANAGSSLADFSTLKMEAIRSSETSVHTRSTQFHIPENLKSSYSKFNRFYMRWLVIIILNV